MQQSCRMLHCTDGLSLQSPLRPLSVLVFHLLLTHSCRASDAASSPDISLLGIDRNRGGVILNCESKGWYPEPEVFWLDSEGNLLSAGPTETVRGPDGLYTVSRRVTVEQRHSNSFTCRVQQKNINQTRETRIHVPDDFFEVKSSSSPIFIGLTVSLAACILLILLLVFFVWKWRQNIKTKRSHGDETGEGKRKNRSKTKTTEDQFVTEEEREREQLTTDETVQMKKAKGKKKNKHLEDKEQAANMQWRKTNEELTEANHQLENENAEISQLKTQVCSLTADVKKLKEEKQKSESERQQLQKELESKKKELQRHQTASASWFSWPRM